MGNVKERSHRVSHSVDQSEPNIGKCHSCDVLGKRHATACFRIVRLFDSYGQVTADHADGLNFKHIRHFPRSFGYVSLNSMGQSVHAGGCCQVSGKAVH